MKDKVLELDSAVVFEEGTASSVDGPGAETGNGKLPCSVAWAEGLRGPLCAVTPHQLPHRVRMYVH